MKEYILRLLGTTILASILSDLLPEEDGKWVRFAAGLFVAWVVLHPMFYIWKDIPVISGIEELSVNGEHYLENAVEEELARKTEAHLFDVCHEEIQVFIQTETDENGRTCCIDQVSLLPYREEVARECAKFLEIEESKVLEA